MSNLIENVIIIEGEYFGCEANVFLKDDVYYFRDEEKNKDIRLEDYLYIRKNGILDDIVFLLFLSRKLDSLKLFLNQVNDISSKKIKEPILLEKSLLSKIYADNVLIFDELKELLRKNKDETMVFKDIVDFINKIKPTGLFSAFGELALIDLFSRAIIVAFSFIVNLFK